MDRFLGRLTFGFLLGQVVPGVFMVAIFWLLYMADHGALKLALAAGQIPTLPWLSLIVVGAFSGVILDQLSWAAGGCIHDMGERKKFKFDRLPSIVIILIGPIGSALPVIYALIFARLGQLNIKEILPGISPDRFNQWEWLQSFYLYPGEFFANTALAAAIVFVPLLLSDTPWPWLVAVWIGAGTFTLLENRAFESLFGAERALADASKATDQATD